MQLLLSMLKREAVLGMMVVALAASAEQPKAGGWVTVATGEITIKTRELPGSAVREILAEANLDAPARDVQSAITNVDRFPSFMPYVKEARLVGTPSADGSRVVYTSLALPFIAGRDFVIADRMVQSLDADGNGEFLSQWKVTDALPTRSNFVRLKTNTGSWRVTPNGAKSHVVYQFSVDPGGQIPGVVADIGNRSGVPDVLHAVEKEARRLAKSRG